ncbi:MAG: deoxyribose-phosphate aldolase [Paludibacter sp.]|nr:deoxyribose-phosphate aldolase [Bacteroidales bacterium]MCM1069367.1 deoxyribose-phosphate aldolase [Prevotella sp.]MCM1353887.1 deoxyribose-phosphate aldolase [Bacteroides sp.]MCM1442863.1 deoxyribose-phosphate aldolase [Muribaculum sp.]MCM1481908.1 deoxyribose-phosphate aldolase [Paludibacter sp.]
MDKFTELFAQYERQLTDAQVKQEVENILQAHFDENNNAAVWKQCLNQIDLTTLNGDDTTEKVRTMTEKVNNFKSQYPDIPNVAAICVYPAMVETVKENLTEQIGIAAVSAGFPASQTFIEVKVAETLLAIQAGATEIDVVISIGKFLEGRYQEVYDELSELRAACKDVHLKVILETGALKSAENIYKASILAMQAGADFIKTSTGKIAVNATPEATYVMCLAIKDWQEKTGIKVSYKPAGGVSTTAEAVQHYTIVKEVLGEEWLNNSNFRFGASRLANNLLSSIVGNETKYF